ncbi:hypothetical protein G7Y89_g13395 [Cudoniella acicularis]|uniref:Ubiquitin fusion degradation protein n=1 Tax=Cudoniella acicularis TaxID=354080 RepID=A0A8H4R9Q5_9HELO|nr:hypothetical protein G7Y89_g13395 [Cudoniella acicularis]
MDTTSTTPPTHADLSTSLLQLLSNPLVLYHTAPYLPVPALLALGASNKSFQSLVHGTPGVFRHLDLTQIKAAQFQLAAIDHGGEVWRNVQLDENVTEDDFYGGPLRGIFSKLQRQHILQDVQTLILDGLSVTSDLVSEIICSDTFNVRILSVREVHHLNERKLQQALLYVIRPSRAPNTPKLEALYIFGPKDVAPVSRFERHLNRYPAGIAPIDTIPSYGGVTYSPGAQIGAKWNQKSGDTLADEIKKNGDKWYQRSGKVIAKPPSEEWAETIRACEGIISFDAVLCHGPRHTHPISADKLQKSTPWYKQREAHLPPRIATCALRSCCKCKTSPEGSSMFGRSPIEHFPLLAPPPLHSSTGKAAKTPSAEDTPDKKLLVRCLECLWNRYCESCHKWWCEDCYEVPDPAFHSSVAPQPWESVGSTTGGNPENDVKCAECIYRTQLMCKVCGGGYCTVHNEGSTLTTAGRHAIDGWCSRSGRRARELY